MRLWFLFILYAIFVIALKSAWNIPCDFLLIAVIYLGFYEDWQTGLLLTLLFGFFLDVVSIGPLGLSIVSFGFVYGLIRFFRKKILMQSWESRFFWVFLFTFIAGIMALGFLDWASQTVDYLKIYLPRLLWASIVNGIFGIFLLSFFKWYRNLKWRDFFKTKDILLKK